MVIMLKYDDNHRESNDPVDDHHPESGGHDDDCGSDDHDDDFGFSDHDDRSLKRNSLTLTFGLRRHKNYCQVLLEIYIAQILIARNTSFLILYIRTAKCSSYLIPIARSPKPTYEKTTINQLNFWLFGWFVSISGRNIKEIYQKWLKIPKHHSISKAVVPAGGLLVTGEGGGRETGGRPPSRDSTIPFFHLLFWVLFSPLLFPSPPTP